MTAPRRGAGEAFIADLLTAVRDPRDRTAVLAALACYRGCTLYLPVAVGAKGARRRQAAETMLRDGMSRADAVRALHERFGVTLRQAQADLPDAKEFLRKISKKTFASAG